MRNRLIKILGMHFTMVKMQTRFSMPCVLLNLFRDWSRAFFVRRLRAGAFFNLYKTKRRMHMEDYKKLYYELFGKITDVIEHLQKIKLEAEEMYISMGDNVADVSQD